MDHWGLLYNLNPLLSSANSSGTSGTRIRTLFREFGCTRAQVEGDWLIDDTAGSIGMGANSRNLSKTSAM